MERSGCDSAALAPFVKVKFADFSLTTLADGQERASPEGFGRLLQQALQRQPKAVRLLGIGGRFPDTDQQQLAVVLKRTAYRVMPANIPAGHSSREA